MNNTFYSPPYRKEGDCYLVELKLKTIAQLYNSLDPAPFHERDLDNDAADYICEAMKELHAHPAVKIVVHVHVHVQEELGQKAADQARDAIRYYFSCRARTRRIELKQQLRIGRISLLVGLLFMGFCFELSNLLSNMLGGIPSVLREGLLIIGWVAMWNLWIFFFTAGGLFLAIFVCTKEFQICSWK